MDEQTSEANSIVVECDMTGEDAVRRYKYLMTSPKGAGCALVFATLVFAAGMIGGITFGLISALHGSPGASGFLIFGVGFGALLVSMCAPMLMLRRNFAASADGEGRHVFDLTPHYYRTTSADTIKVFRWRKFTSIAIDKGDIYFSTAPMMADVVPRRAFASTAEAERVYEVIRGYHDADRVALSGQSAPDVWPPAPQAISKPEDIPVSGPVFAPLFQGEHEISGEELKTFTWYLSGIRLLTAELAAFTFGWALSDARLPFFGFTGWDEVWELMIWVAAVTLIILLSASIKKIDPFFVRVETDYQWIRFIHRDDSVSIRVSALHKIGMSPLGMLVWLAPGPASVLTTPVFGTPERARDVAERLQAVIRDGKRGPRTEPPTA